MASFDELPATIRGWSKEAHENAIVAVKAASIAAMEAVVKSTPVDTGTARSNWVTTVDTLFEGQIPAYAPYPKYSGPKLDETANAEAAIAQGTAAVQGFTTSNKEVIIQNNVDYIERLNDGSASLQSSHMLELGAQAAADAGAVIVLLKA